MTANELSLPWPARDLHPNARVHWARKAKAAKAARFAARLIALEAGWGRLKIAQHQLHLLIDAYPPDNRRRDADGVLASLKSALDGVADALGIDDHRFVIHSFLHRHARIGGEIRVRITSCR